MKIYVVKFKSKKEKKDKKKCLQNVTGSDQVTITKAGRKYLQANKQPDPDPIRRIWSKQ